MAETEKTSAAKKTPKGGRRGGTLFPKIGLKQALEYSVKLVSKTHTGPLPEKTILPGVFGNAGASGKVRASALKQYGLLEGGVSAYRATELAKKIDAAPEEERGPLLKRAFLSAKLFNQIFETFHGDTISKPKVEQRAKGLDVHPDSATECAQLFIDSAIIAGLGALDGDSISLAVKSEDIVPDAQPVATNCGENCTEGQEGENSDNVDSVERVTSAKNKGEASTENLGKPSTKPGVTLTLTVDPSSDPDKLEKQLKLLRQYGMI